MNCNNYNSVKIHFSPEGYSLVSVSNIEKDYFFLLDTGSTKSLLFYTHNKYKKNEEGNSTSDNSKIQFSLGKHKFNHTFIKDTNISHILKNQSIIGILGVDFFVKNKCIINYIDKTFSWKNSEWHNIPATKFRYPLQLGLKKIGMPVICMTNDFSSIGCLVDTGSTTNIIVADSLSGFGVKANSNETSTIILCGRKLNTKILNVTFKIANYLSSPIVFKDNFSVISNNIDLYASNSEPYFEGILGNSFLRQNKWIIDFSNKAMYFF